MALALSGCALRFWAMWAQARGKVGRGVRLCRVLSLQVAIKMMSKKTVAERGIEAKVCKEIRVLRTLQHPQLIKLYQVMHTAKDIFLVHLPLVPHLG